MKTNTTHNTATCDYCAGPDATVTTDYGDTICVPCFIGKPVVVEINEIPEVKASAKVLTDIAGLAYETWCHAYAYDAPKELLTVLENAYQIANKIARETRTGVI